MTPETRHTEPRRMAATATAWRAALLVLLWSGFDGICGQFDHSVRPILVRHCLKCHGGIKPARGLSFVTGIPSDAVGGSGRRILSPGRPEDSEIYRRIVSTDGDARMPPPEKGEGVGLGQDEIDAIRKWIENGAGWERHWSHREPSGSDPPRGEGEGWSRGRVDQFVLAGMEAAGLTPAVEASPEVWLRRASLDLTGLPPSLEELDRFLEEESALGEAAFERATDRLLATPAFGERWAADWLDLARYADSKGLGRDGRRTIWKYRDWVIDAFNADLPFDRFTVKQLAGDLLPNPGMGDLIATGFHRNTQANDEGGTDDEQFRVEAVIDRVNTTWQVWQGSTLACAQCHAHPHDPFSQEDYYRILAFFNNTADSDSGNDDPALQVPLAMADHARARRLDVRIAGLKERLWKPVDELRRKAGVWRALGGLKVRSRYGTRIAVEKVAGVEEFVLPAEVKQKTSFSLEAPVPEGMSRLTAIRLVAKPRNPARALKDSEWGFIVTRLKAELLPPAGGAVAKTIPLRFAFADEPDPFYDPVESLRNGNFGFAAYTRINHPREAVFLPEQPASIAPGSRIRVSMDHSVFLLASFTLVVKRGSVAVSDDERWADLVRNAERNEWRRELEALKADRAAIPAVPSPVMQERPEWLRRPTHIFERGDYLAKGPEIAPGFPEAFSARGSGDGTDAPERGRRNRLDLARWLVGPDNPLTARVTVNRYWSQVFGRGLVGTLDDFGVKGAPPSHPELLDDLARRFQTSMRWSVKALLRELVLSATYRQTAAVPAEKRAADPDNRWLARGSRRRLAAEMIRDQALRASGLLNPGLHGAPARPPIPEGSWKPFSDDPWVVDPDDGRHRRSLYTYVKRTIPYPTFAVFDSPTREYCVARRAESNTPLQALTLLNDAALAECASALARRMDRVGGSTAERIAHGCRTVLSRDIGEASLRDLLALHARAVKEYEAMAAGEHPEATPELSALFVVAGVLLNLDEVLTR